MKYDAIVVLAGGITDDGAVPETVKARIRFAHDIFKQKKASRIILSGCWSWFREKHRPLRTEAAAMFEYAQSLGIPRECLLKEEQSHDTRGNAFFTKLNWLEPKKWRRVFIITSDFHVPRAQRIFKHILGNEYEVHCIGVKTSPSIKKRLKWWFVEISASLLDTNRFTQYFFQR